MEADSLAGLVISELLEGVAVGLRSSSGARSRPHCGPKWCGLAAAAGCTRPVDREDTRLANASDRALQARESCLHTHLVNNPDYKKMKAVNNLRGHEQVQNQKMVANGPNLWP